MLRIISGSILALPVLAAMAIPMVKRATSFFDPPSGNGSWFDVAGPGVGEPLNVSGNKYTLLCSVYSSLNRL